MADLEDHPEKLSTQGQYLHKGPIVSLAKDQVEEKCLPYEVELSDISAVEVRFKEPLDGERKIEVVQGCAGEDYAQVIVIADGMAQIQSGRTHNAMALELCKATKKAWQIAGHNNDDEEDDDNNDDSVGLETSLGAVKHKQSSIHKKK